jgi:hypothetical protein
LGLKGRGILQNLKGQGQTRKANLKPYHWLKLTRAVQGSLWAEAQKSDEAATAPDFDISELEKLFSAVNLSSDSENNGGKSGRRARPKVEKVQLFCRLSSDEHTTVRSCSLKLKYLCLI